ncbi:hypothetical protein QB607_003113 [Clostridium botulinum]|nr:hypothetical protein [Clostridium botulinum]EKS4395786.1 hypothetical protein [Clostridium botulinum]
MWKQNKKGNYYSSCTKCCVQCDKSKYCDDYSHSKDIHCGKCCQDYYYVSTNV